MPKNDINKLSLLTRQEALGILFQLREKSCRFKELSGNSFTKSKRLKELKEVGLIEYSVSEEKKGKPTINYQLTKKGEEILSTLDKLLKELTI
ncbi:winged helix-turn-helix transcriptional regulator [Candidatus Micrarchaeota archaeon]|nr:winged helix-turn-helix transcriptional regulator [Candidatus Micrarchaeota archaeon]